MQLDVLHHVANAYYLDFSPLGKIELPRILIDAEGAHLFPSTTAALRDGRFVPAEWAEKTASQAPTEATEEEPSALHEVGKLARRDGRPIYLDLSLTRHGVFMLLAGLLLVGIFIPLAGRYRAGVGRTSAPRGAWQNLWEAIVLFIRDEVAIPNLGQRHYQRYMPYLLTAFFFILFCNLLGLVPFGATATGNITVTAVLALFTFVITQLSGSRDYWRHIFWMPGVPVALRPILALVEFLGLFTKPFALAIRLFANMTAGHVAIVCILGLIFVFASLSPALGYAVAPFSVAVTLGVYGLELLVALLQAYIFTILSAVFIAGALEEHHHEEDHATH
ncbi:MAG: F0F1 ATP synthase subunit A [Bacteroidetes bacterium]|nr:F0F1 ATP synthase subunit A [Rhodothermia bacterium]MCS7154404.1 F0F1 ATP synthase subunit A [Bacteroidota bacterium]MCX7907649.1 F0F1 ATP synthase subunit A [Bacteroidota bacterium]MDW8137778.1 F0F1 ATP synthase subunit A [Bacteroidota bacterium]MDW8286371.1 F0F1 ATP synthase subunit A [Bacteroidota bacterium]